MTTDQKWELAWLTAGSLLACLILIGIRYSWTSRANSSVTLGARMGQGHWDFSQSFASNITIVGSTLTLLLTSGAFPNGTKILPSSAYGGLAIFFGILIVVAPLIYNGTAKRVHVSADNVDTADEYHGTVWGFLAATLMTDWGLAGSVSTVFVALLDLYDASSLSGLPLILLAVALAASLLAFVRYNWVRINGTLLDQLDPDRKAARVQRSTQLRASLTPELAAPTDSKPPPAPRWALL